MESMVFQSPKKHRIIAIKNLLLKNSIPVTSIKIHINVGWSLRNKYGQGITDERERRDELIVPIEDFNEKLNDAQTFEIYTGEEHEDMAIKLIEECDEETFFDDCIFKTNNYDEAFEIYLLLNKNNIICDDIIPAEEKYLLFIDPEDKEEALKLIEHKDDDKERPRENQETRPRQNPNEIFVQESHEKKIYKFIIPLVIILCILLIKIDNKFIFEILINKINVIIRKNTNNDITVDYDLSSLDESEIKTIHVFVALCDNKYQGITRVSAALGDGQNINTNLYWGARYGIRSYFKKSEEWKLLTSRKEKGIILERLIFKHVEKNYFLIADAYDGKYIRQCTLDFLNSGSGKQKDSLQINGKNIGTGGNASLLAYIGHDGLMDFQLSEDFVNTDNIKRDMIILACYSKKYFTPVLEQANVNMLVWTTNLMAPEAYTLHDALTGYVNGETNEEIREKAAAAYSKYQKCSLNAAKGLLVTEKR